MNKYCEWDITDKIAEYLISVVINEGYIPTKKNIKKMINLVYLDDIIEIVIKKCNERNYEWIFKNSKN